MALTAPSLVSAEPLRARGTARGRVPGGRTITVVSVVCRMSQLAFMPAVVLLGWFMKSHLAVAIVLYTTVSFFFTFPRPGLTTYAVEIATKRAGAKARTRARVRRT